MTPEEPRSSRETAPLLSNRSAGWKDAARWNSIKVEKWRNAAGFWILGLTNNYPFIIMLSAAFDILDTLEGEDDHGGRVNGTIADDRWGISLSNVSNHSSTAERDCHKQSTGVVLLANILPTFIIKLTLPYVMNFIPYWIRVLTIVAFSAVSFVVVGLNGLAFNNAPLVFMGIVCASISSGFGELTFLAFTARYDKSTVAGWSSGTGAAAVVGSVAYLVLRTFLSTQVTVLMQVFMPVLLLINFTFILGKPSPNPVVTSDRRYDLRKEAEKTHMDSESDRTSLLLSEESSLITSRSVYHTKPQKETETTGCTVFNKHESVHWRSHVQYVPRLLKYMLPLFVVYIAEYMINQGLYELFVYPDPHLGKIKIDQPAQYRVLQVMYQVGVLISRSSIFVLHIKHFWILSLLQVVNFVFLFCEAVYYLLPSFWITFFIILYEGLLGGGAYANAFYSITKEVPEVHREFSMGLASVADSTGIAAAGVASIFIHKYICSLPP